MCQCPICNVTAITLQLLIQPKVPFWDQILYHPDINFPIGRIYYFRPVLCRCHSFAIPLVLRLAISTSTFSKQNKTNWKKATNLNLHTDCSHLGYWYISQILSVLTPAHEPTAPPTPQSIDAFQCKICKLRHFKAVSASCYCSLLQWTCPFSEFLRNVIGHRIVKICITVQINDKSMHYKKIKSNPSAPFPVLRSPLRGVVV